MNTEGRKPDQLADAALFRWIFAIVGISICASTLKAVGGLTTIKPTSMVCTHGNLAMLVMKEK